MKVFNLTGNCDIYTSNVYLITGFWNALSDLNTLIDVGRDRTILEGLEKISTGVGKRRIEQVIITHNHYDHVGILPEVIKLFHPKVYAFSYSLAGVDCRLYGGEIIKIGDADFEVIHTPGHSSDSICLYSPSQRVLFAGDTPLVINSPGRHYEEEFIGALEYLVKQKIETIYFGHGPPVMSNCRQILIRSLKNAKI